LKPPLVDTDVWIDFLRGHPLAVEFVQLLPQTVFISAVSVAELHVGVREGRERQALADLLSSLKVLPLDENSATQGGLIRRDFGKSHGLGLNDALIAATAIQHACVLFTLNVKHYPTLPGDQVQRAYNKV
jgi:predicted nucleic acid-binding protein